MAFESNRVINLMHTWILVCCINLALVLHFISSFFGRSVEHKTSLTRWWLSWDNTNMRSSSSSSGGRWKLLCRSETNETRVLSFTFYPLSNYCKAVCVFILNLFHSTCACVEYFGRALEVFIKNVTILCIHGKMKDKRNKIFSEFRELKR